MNKLLFTFIFIFSSLSILAQNSNIKLYDPELDAQEQVEQALRQAREENKHVLIQVGGNWCSWCLKLHHFIDTTPRLDSLVKADYVLIRINYSKENKNPEMMAQLGFPQRFGFPVLIVLDQDGKRIHTQNTGYLEEDESYSEKKISEFLRNWNRRAVDPDTYKPKE